MKMSEINENLTEAPEEFGAKQGLAKRLKTKLKKHTPFSKGARAQATRKDQIFKLAKELKTQFAEYMANEPEGTEPSIEDLQQFFSDTEYERYLMPVATKLKLVKPQAAPNDVEDETKLVPNDVEDETKPVPAGISDEEKQADHDKIAADAEAEAKELNPEDDVEQEVEEDSEKPAVDLSASIYEARLYNMLTELKDNEIDTLFVRMLQAQGKAKGGPAPLDSDSDSDSEEDQSYSSSSKDSGRQISDDEISNLKNRLDEFSEDVKDIIRKQSNVDDAAKKEIISKIQGLIIDMIDDSF